MNLLSISGRLKPAKLWNHEPAKTWNHEPAKIWNHEPAKIKNHEPVKIWNPEPAKIRNLGPTKLWVRIPEIRESRRGSLEIRKKSSQRRYLEKSGFDV
jgi:hypothetical protein